MSKWIKDDLFEEFVNEKESESEEQKNFGFDRREMVWETPEKGTQHEPNVYSGRFLPDKNGVFYLKIYYHMFRSGDKWEYFICPKTHGMDEFCPICEATSKLWSGTSADKNVARDMKRKQKFIGNFFISDDPRDAKRDDEKKVNNTVKIYEFPGVIESKVKNEITDKKHGLGKYIFDPGEDGFDFILKIKSKTPDSNGKVWPDYNDSIFARRPYALADSDDGIKKIMESTHDIGQYIKNGERPIDEMINVLKVEHLWDYVEEKYNRVMGSDDERQEMVNQHEKELDVAFGGNTDSSEDSDDFGEEPEDDESLLKEIEELGD